MIGPGELRPTAARDGWGHGLRRALVASLLAASLAGCGDGVATLTLRASLAEGSPYWVAPGESVVCFGFEGEPVGLHAVRLAPSVAPVVHHVSLHRASALPVGGDCASFGPSTLLYVWSPGDAPFAAPDGTALVVTEAPDDVLVLEVHYLNGTGAPAEDRSGVVLDLAPGDDAVELGMWITGVPVLEIPPRATGHVEERRCEVRSPGPVTLHAVSPHMHVRGVALSVRLTRGATEEVVVDLDPFDPRSQRTAILEPALTLEPGDLITTRCVYDNPSDATVRYGTTLEDEMCFAYFWASPIGLLREDAAFCH